MAVRTFSSISPLSSARLSTLVDGQKINYEIDRVRSICSATEGAELLAVSPMALPRRSVAGRAIGAVAFLVDLRASCSQLLELCSRRFRNLKLYALHGLVSQIMSHDFYHLREKHMKRKLP